MDIFFDLDNTLIEASLEQRLGGVPVDIASGQTAIVTVRPGVEALLAGARKIGAVRLLTASTRGYSVPIAALPELGFREDEIFARDDYMTVGGFSSYGGTRDLFVEKQNQFPGSVLIDDLHPDNPYARCKQMFLGISSERFIRVNAFYAAAPTPIDAEAVLAAIERLR